MQRQEEAVLGFISGLSGVYGWMAEDQLDGTKMAVDEINAAGGIAGHAVRIVTRDDESKPDLAETRTAELIHDEHADFIIGSLAANTHLHINAETQKAGKIFMSIGQSNEITAAPNVGKYTFHEAFTPHMASQTIGRWIHEHLGKRWYLICADYEWGRSLVESYKGLAARLGADIAGVSMVPFPAKSPEDFAAHFEEILATAPEVLIVNNYGADQLKLIRAANAAGLKRKMSIIFTISEINIIERVDPDEAVSMYWGANFYWKLADKQPNAKRFVDQFRTRYKRVPSGYAAYGYSGALELLGAAQRLGTFPIDSDAIAAALESRTYAHYKEGQWWRPCDHQSFQDYYVLKLKGAEERRDADDNSEIVGVSSWDMRVEHTCEELGHHEYLWGHATPPPLGGGAKETGK